MSEYERATDAAFVAQRDADVSHVLAALRHHVRTSERTQRSIETQNQFQHGYLSQVLQGHISLTVRHLLGILGSLDVPAARFFAHLDDPNELGAPPELSEIRERMAKYDAAFEELADRGLLSHPVSGPDRHNDG